MATPQPAGGGATVSKTMAGGDGFRFPRTDCQDAQPSPGVLLRGSHLGAVPLGPTSVGSQSFSELKNRGHNHEDPDGNNNGEHRSDKKAGDYHFDAPFSPLHIALPRGWL
jgi:hypothetical protein